MLFMFAAPPFGGLIRHVRQTGLLFISTLVLILLFVQGCQINVGDQSCAEGVNFYDKEDACPYGPPGGPKIKVEANACPDIMQVDPTTCTTTFADVYAVFDGTTANCTNGGCHGTAPGARGIHLPTGNPTAFYEELKGYAGSLGYPYINQEDPGHSWIMCNLTGVPGGGAPMPPPSGLTQADLDIVQTWAQCGMPSP